MVALSVVSSAGNDSVWLLEGPVSVSCRSVIVEDSAMKGFFLVKRACLDEEPGMGFLSSRAKAPTQKDNTKLMKISGHLK